MANYLGGQLMQRREEENMRTEEDRGTPRSDEIRNDPLETEHSTGREPPSSQVGYGGGNRESEFAHDQHVQNADASLEQHDHLGERKGHGGQFEGGHGHSDPRLSEGQPMTTSSETHDMTDENAKPSESGLESVRPGEDVRESGGSGDQSRSYGMTDGNAKSSESGLESVTPGEDVRERGGSGDQSRTYGMTDGNAKPSESGLESVRPGEDVRESVGPGDQSRTDGNAKPSELESASESGPNHQSRSYGIADANSKPSESGFGNSGPGGYTEEGGSKLNDEAGTGKSHLGGGYVEAGDTKKKPITHKSTHYQDSNDHWGGLPAPTRPPGAVVQDENYFDGPRHNNEPSNQSSDRLQEGEVRDGVPHSVVSGHASGAGQENHGENEVSRAPTSGPGPVGHQGIEPQEYHQTGSVPHPDGSAYSQQYTQPDGRSTDASKLEGAQQPSKPTPMEESGKAPTVTEESDEHQKGGLMAKIKSHLPGHHKHHVETESDKKHETPPTTAAPEHEKPDCMEKIKDKLKPKHRDQPKNHDQPNQ